MAIAFDAASRGTVNQAASHSWTHTPVGASAGVVVAIGQTANADSVSAVTYGGVSMGAPVVNLAQNSGETMRVWLYFLGSGIPTGAQSVAVTAAGSGGWTGFAATVTSTSGVTEVDISNSAAPAIGANPSLILNYTDALADWEAFYILESGLNAPIATVEAGGTHVNNGDNGNTTAMFARKSGTGGTSTTLGYTAASDDICHAGLVLKEGVVVAAASLTPYRSPYRRILAG